MSDEKFHKLLDAILYALIYIVVINVAALVAQPLVAALAGRLQSSFTEAPTALFTGLPALFLRLVAILSIPLSIGLGFRRINVQIAQQNPSQPVARPSALKPAYIRKILIKLLFAIPLILAFTWLFDCISFAKTGDINDFQVSLTTIAFGIPLELAAGLAVFFLPKK